MKCQVCDGDGIVRDVTAALSGNDACPHCHGSGLEPKGHDGQFDKEEKAQEQVKRLHATTDAAVWAKEFQEAWRNYRGDAPELDEGWLIGWFANAIEVGRDAGKRSADLSARGRILFEDDSFCPGCGHNRDESSVSTIKLNDGRRECQMCGALWSEVDHSSYVVVCSEEKK